ncbi:hypothetical protein U1Q18_019153 [Sarracenia purpurea var. burkii]
MEQKSRGVDCGHGSNGERSCSLPTFNNPNPGYKQQHSVQTNTFQIQGKPRGLQHRLKQPRTVKQQHGGNGDKNSRNGKKGILRRWPHLRILGC